LRPNASDKLRVQQALQARLQSLSSGVATQLSLAPARKAPLALWPKVVAIGAAVGVGASLVLVFLPGTQPTTNDTPMQNTGVGSVALPPMASEVAKAEQGQNTGATDGLQQLPPRSAPVASAASREGPSREGQAVDPLRAEVALLKRAQKEFQAGRYQVVLAIVDEHRRRFPSGSLAQEAGTLRARALCASGKDDTSVERGATPATPCRDPR
jgi:hypothetical protein